MPKVQITKGAGWYRGNVGEEFEVGEELTLFRKENGGARVQHYIVKEREHGGGATRQRLIQRTHAKPVKDLTPAR